MEDPPFFGGSIGIIGGRGRMGRWLKGFLERAGCGVRTADVGQEALSLELASQCRVLILAVPISRMAAVMERLGPATRQDGLLMDLCSVKGPPLEAMLKHAQGSVVGCHPLFGPGLESLEGQVVFLCPGRGETALSLVERFVRRAGGRPVVLDPLRHDRLMAQVQTLRHFLLAALGGALLELGFDPESERDLGGPWFGELLDLLGRQLEQPGELYAELAVGNPEARGAVRTLGRVLSEMQMALERDDRDALAGRMDRLFPYLREERSQSQQNLDARAMVG